MRKMKPRRVRNINRPFLLSFDMVKNYVGIGRVDGPGFCTCGIKIDFTRCFLDRLPLYTQILALVF